MGFTFALTVGAALLAVWLDVRLASIRPQEPLAILLHAAISIFGLFAAVGLLYLVHGVPQSLFLVAVLTLFLPALVYALVAGAWLLRAFAGLARAG
jgi:hypothetical protein